MPKTEAKPKTRKPKTSVAEAIAPPATSDKKGPPFSYPGTFNVRATSEFKQWARRAAAHCGVSDLPNFAGVAMVELARSRGFTEPAPARMPAESPPHLAPVLPKAKG